MPPRTRKRPNSSTPASSAKKPNHQNQSSQPSKYTIQHFFDRRTQNAVPASTKQPDEEAAVSDPPALKHKPTRNQRIDLVPQPMDGQSVKNGTDFGDSKVSVIRGSRMSTGMDGDAKELQKIDGRCTGSVSDNPVSGVTSNSLQVTTPPENLISLGGGGVSSIDDSPENSKAMPLKRFKFSPGMLIKQSQDDAGEEITWKISPVNERLQAVSKHMPEVIKVLAESSKLNSLYIRQCSQSKSSSAAAGKVDMWLSSPLGKACERPLSCADKKGTEVVYSFQTTGLKEIITDGSSTSHQSPFQTPPSLSYSNDKPVSSSAGKGSSNQLVSRHQKKALLELLDQVEDAISVEDTTAACTDAALFDRKHVHGPTKPDAPAKTEADLSENVHDVSLSRLFLVLEVAEKRSSGDSLDAHGPYKVLRLLNEMTGEEQSLYLWDEWFYSVISPGDTVNVIGEFDENGKCDINRDKNLIILHPDLLVSGSRVAGSFSCPRRAVLDERLKNSEHSIAALVGTMLHQIFQAGLLKENLTQDFLEEYASIVLQKNLETLYACGASQKDIFDKLMEAVPKLISWIQSFKDSQLSEAPGVDFGSDEGTRKLKISEVIDIEEMAWAPNYGLKGMIDASIRVKVQDGSAEATEKIMPLEFKSGKANGQSSMEHTAQVIFYTLLMSERYLKPIDSGLLYYLQSNHTQGVCVRRSDLIGLIMRRNEFANDMLKALTAQQLPSMLQSPSMCKSCRHLNVCTLYHKANGGSMESSGLGNLFDACTNHLSTAHSTFLRHWNWLIDLEAKVAEHGKKEVWRSQSIKNINRSGSLSSVVLDTSFKLARCKPSKENRFIYRFVHQDFHQNKVKAFERDVSTSAKSSSCDLSCTLRCGDYVILSTESDQQAIANGVISDISRLHVSISFSRRLRVPRKSQTSRAHDLNREVWRIDKDEPMSSFAVMRFNIVQLFLGDARISHLRKMIVDLEAPRFDSGCIFSQDPAISYVWSEQQLNDDQRRAILKILTAKDYALILGMPGTGKTSTMVHAVKALLIRGSSVLLTSYTNSAVDNLLIKLKDQGIDFLRLGRDGAVHEEIRDYCFSTSNMKSIDDIKQRLEQVKVVAVTCLGVTSPLLAKKRFDVCIMDEAGQTTLPVALGPLMFASTFVLVGDHYQLPPLVQSTEARENGLGVSLFCRLSEAHPQAVSQLQSQYRMCQGVMQLANALIYGDRLQCGSSDVANAKLTMLSNSKPRPPWLKEVLNSSQSVIFINTDLLPGLEEKDQKTINNPVEACIIAEITEELLSGGIMEEDIGIITPYNAQVNLIRNSVSTSVEIHTIDKYQGRDKDCILVSFVRSVEKGSHCNSSLLGDWQRINVALTRAKKKLIMVGSCRTLSKLPLLKLLIEKVEEQSGLLNLSKADFVNKA